MEIGYFSNRKIKKALLNNDVELALEIISLEKRVDAYELRLIAIANIILHSIIRWLSTYAWCCQL